jgi:hypothetical protein
MARSQALIQHADDRWSKRYRLLLDARAELADVGVTPVTIHDLSDTGLLLETRADLQEDAELFLDIQGFGSVAAQVVWRSGKFFGARFATPLTADRLRSLHSKSKVVWPEFKPAPAMTSLALGPSAALLSDEFVPGAVERKLPVAVRIQIVLAISLGLWSLVIASGWTLLH